MSKASKNVSSPTPPVEEKPTIENPAPQEIGDDEPLSILLTRKELDTLSNGARALELMRVFEEARGMPAIITFPCPSRADCVTCNGSCFGPASQIPG